MGSSLHRNIPIESLYPNHCELGGTDTPSVPHNYEWVAAASQRINGGAAAYSGERRRSRLFLLCLAEYAAPDIWICCEVRRESD